MSDGQIDKSRLAKLLLQMQWDTENSSSPCRCCREGYKYGHREDCELALHLQMCGEKVKFIDRKEYPVS